MIDQLDELADGEICIRDWYAEIDDGSGVINTVGEGRLDAIQVKQDDGAILMADTNSEAFEMLVQAMAQFGSKPAAVTDVVASLQDEYSAAWQLATPQAA